MIELIPDMPENVLGLTAKGEVTADDYEKTLIPAVEQKVKEMGRIRVLVYIGPEFENYKAGAVWEDTKVGVEYWKSWEKIAVVTDVDWIRNSVQAFGWLAPGEVKLFNDSEMTAAIEWAKT